MWIRPFWGIHQTFNWSDKKAFIFLHGQCESTSARWRILIRTKSNVCLFQRCVFNWSDKKAFFFFMVNVKAPRPDEESWSGLRAMSVCSKDVFEIKQAEYHFSVGHHSIFNLIYSIQERGLLHIWVTRKAVLVTPPFLNLYAQSKRNALRACYIFESLVKQC